MDKSLKNVPLTLGVIFQLVGLFCFFTFWLMYCSIVFFTIGTLLIILARQRWYFKLLAIIPMVIAIVIVVRALTFEKYIIPENFTGVVYIITDKEYGVNREYELFTRVFRIPESGVLFTKFVQKPGFNNRKFYQIKGDSIVQLGVLDYRHYIEKWTVNPRKTEPSRDSLAVFTPNLDFNFNTDDYRMTFTFGKYKDITTWNYIPNERIDSLRMEIKK